MSNIRAVLSRMADREGKVTVDEAIEAIGKCKIQRQCQTFRTIEWAPTYEEAWAAALKRLLWSIGMSIMLGRGGRPGRVIVANDPYSNKKGVELTIQANLEILDWDDEKVPGIMEYHDGGYPK